MLFVEWFLDDWRLLSVFFIKFDVPIYITSSFRLDIWAVTCYQVILQQLVFNLEKLLVDVWFSLTVEVLTVPISSTSRPSVCPKYHFSPSWICLGNSLWQGLSLVLFFFPLSLSMLFLPLKFNERIPFVFFLKIFSAFSCPILFIYLFTLFTI